MYLSNISHNLVPRALSHGFELPINQPIKMTDWPADARAFSRLTSREKRPGEEAGYHTYTTVADIMSVASRGECLHKWSGNAFGYTTAIGLHVTLR